MGEIFSGRYELVDPLGRGGSGDVWRVWDHKRSQYQAGKVLQQSDSASLLRFVRETGWRFDHPHIVAPLGWVGEDDRIMFSMPLVHGGAISTLLSERGPLPAGYVAGVADQMLDALETVHGAGLVHRDLKPGNILMEPNPSGLPDARLADFGIAAKVGEPRMTRIAEVVGTPGFMSPEARMGADPDPAQDIYALGVVLAELLTADRPVGDDPPPMPQGLRSSPLGRFIAICLEDVGRRYPDAGAARQELSRIRGGLGLARIVIPDRTPALPPGWGPGGPNSSTRPDLRQRPAPRMPMSPSPLSGPSVPSRRMPSAPPGPGPRPARGWSPASAPMPRASAPVPAQMTRSAPVPRTPTARTAPPARSGSGVTAKDIVLGAGVTAGIALVVVVVLLIVT